MSLEIHQGIASEEERFTYQSALLCAFESSQLNYFGWDRQEFLRQVIDPALFPEFYPRLEHAKIVSLCEYSHTESIDNYRLDLDYAFIHLSEGGVLPTGLVREVRAFLGWTAINPEAAIIPFDTTRAADPAAAPAQHEAEIIPFPVQLGS